jgi:hypothetical protein
MNKTLSALLLSGILGAMALPALADTEPSGGNSTGTTMPTTPDDTKPMPPADDEDGIPAGSRAEHRGQPGRSGCRVGRWYWRQRFGLRLLGFRFRFRHW